MVKVRKYFRSRIPYLSKENEETPFQISVILLQRVDGVIPGGDFARDAASTACEAGVFISIIVDASQTRGYKRGVAAARAEVRRIYHRLVQKATTAQDGRV